LNQLQSSQLQSSQITKFPSYKVPNYKIPKLQNSQWVQSSQVTKFPITKFPRYNIPKLQNSQFQSSQVTKFPTVTKFPRVKKFPISFLLWVKYFVYCPKITNFQWHFLAKKITQLTIICEQNVYNPLTPSGESCSDWAENFSVASFIYLKNIMFYALIFYLALLKINSRFCPFNF
jgi:hypothetical protein